MEADTSETSTLRLLCVVISISSNLKDTWRCWRTTMSQSVRPWNLRRLEVKRRIHATSSSLRGNCVHHRGHHSHHREASLASAIRQNWWRNVPRQLEAIVRIAESHLAAFKTVKVDGKFVEIFIVNTTWGLAKMELKEAIGLFGTVLVLPFIQRVLGYIMTIHDISITAYIFNFT